MVQYSDKDSHLTRCRMTLAVSIARVLHVSRTLLFLHMILRVAFRQHGPILRALSWCPNAIRGVMQARGGGREKRYGKSVLGRCVETDLVTPPRWTVCGSLWPAQQSIPNAAADCPTRLDSITCTSDDPRLRRGRLGCGGTKVSGEELGVLLTAMIYCMTTSAQLGALHKLCCHAAVKEHISTPT